MSDSELGWLDATVPMHPHDTVERRFVCYCGAAHSWGEKGTLTFRLPVPQYACLGWQMIRCDCKTWHMKYIEAQEAENIIKEGI